MHWLDQAASPQNKLTKILVYHINIGFDMEFDQFTQKKWVSG